MLSITLIVMPFQGFSVTNLYKYHSASGKIAHPHGISLNASGILIFPIRINILNSICWFFVQSQDSPVPIDSICLPIDFEVMSNKYVT